MFCKLGFVCVLASCAMLGQVAQAQSATQPAAAADAKPVGSSAVGDAFQSMFNPVAAPRVRTMGSIQRTNFLDELLTSRGRMQIAFVIDGTESMAEQLQGVRQQLGAMIGDLRRVLGNGLSVQMIIYRDEAAASGAIAWPLPIGKKSWAEDDATIATGLAQLVPESGAPYFYEQVDAGLYAAMNELAWSRDEAVHRWIFLIGDAPPFRAGFSEPANKASRRYDSELLKRVAEQKRIRVHGLLCPSRKEDSAVYQQVLPECRQFFEDITSATGGMLLDLSDATVRTQVQAAAAQAAQNFVVLKPITQADIEMLRAAAKNPTQRVRVAVLPFLELRSMDFSPSNPMTQLAEEVRSQLDQNGIETRHLSRLETEIARAKRRRVQDSELPQHLGQQLEVEYVIWGRPVATANTGFQAEVYDVRTGKTVVVTDAIDPSSALAVNASAAGGPNTATTASPLNVRLCALVIKSLSDKSKVNNQQVARVFSGKFQTRLVSTSEDGARAIQEARLYLQKSLNFSASLDSSDSIARAEKELQRVAEKESANPLWNNLMANVAFAKAMQLRLGGGKRVEVRRWMGLAKTHSEAAFKSRGTPEYSKEFEADHWLFAGEFERAIQGYEGIVEESVSPETIARARWMLVFLYLGDWGVAETTKLQNLEKARQYAIALLAFHPKSDEALALKHALHWSEQEERTLFAALPIEELSPSDRRLRP